MRVVQPEGIRGSLKWIQKAIEQGGAMLRPVALPAMRWVSPLREYQFTEYCDAAFLDAIGQGRLTPLAGSDLRAIYLEGLRLYGEAQARRYLLRLSEEMRFIREFPFVPRLREEFVPPVRVHPVAAHVIIFEVREEEVIIARIRHGREDCTPNS